MLSFCHFINVYLIAEMNGQIILEEDYDENYVPTEEEIFEYARVIGLDPDKESDLLWIAREGINAPLPVNWKPCQDTNGDIYYFNFETGDSIWDHPCDEFYRRMVLEERQKKQSKLQVNMAAGVNNKKKEKESKPKKKKKATEHGSSLGPLNQSKLGDVHVPSASFSSIGGGTGGLAPLRGVGPLKPSALASPLGDSLIADIAKKQDPLQLTASSMGSTAELGKINLDKLKTQDLQQHSIEYQASDDDDDIDNMNISSNSDDESSSSSKSNHLQNLMDIEKLHAVEDELLSEESDDHKMFKNAKPGEAAAKAAEMRMYGSLVKSSTPVQEQTKLVKTEATADATSMDLIFKSAKNDVNTEQIRENLLKEKNEAIIKLKDELANETEKEKNKLKKNQTEELLKFEQEIKKDTETKTRHLTKEADIKIEKLKNELESKIKAQESLKFDKELQDSLEFEKSKFETEKNNKLKDLKLSLEAQFVDAESDMIKKLEEEKLTKLNKIRAENEESLKFLKQSLEKEHHQNREQMHNRYATFDTVTNEHEKSYRSIMDEKLNVIQEEQEREIAELNQKHKTRLNMLKSEHENQYKDEVEQLRRKMKIDLQVEKERLESENEAKIRTIVHQYKRSNEELQNDFDMLANKRRQFEKEEERINEAEKNLQSKKGILQSTLNSQQPLIKNVEVDISEKLQYEEEIASLKQKQQELYHRLALLQSSKSSDNEKALADTDLQMKDLNSSSFLKEKPDDSLPYPSYPRKAWEKEEDGLMKAREFLYRQQQSLQRKSVRNVSWHKSVIESEKQLQTEKSKQLVSDVRSTLEKEAVDLSANPLWNSNRNSSSYASWLGAGTNDSTNLASPKPLNRSHSESDVVHGNSEHVMEYLRTVDAKLNQIMNLIGEKERQPYAGHKPSQPFYPSNMVSDIVERELTNSLKKYFGGPSMQSTSLFDKQPYWHYVSGRDLMENKGHPYAGISSFNSFTVAPGLSRLTEQYSATTTPRQQLSSPRNRVRLVVNDKTNEVMEVNNEM